ncbi:MAG: Asp-tRNA(Asn)/Glu-tRNA(Gln) amidotransferase subunit GatA [Candidatus Helarchaeota archaeon]|nr:Asp-tRNA(Asn)/Glu-tRNA(Gln) amidotransferase subunit GatA [Candidatus Helarchaeota archaeon]
MIKRGEISVIDLVQSVFQRIEAVEDKIYGYSSLLKKEALESAKEIDKKIKNKKKMGGLAGIPIAIKDNMNVFNTQTSCGSHILESYISVYDSTVVARLKQADSIILGKTRMDEFAMGSSTESCYYGPTYNPWDLNRVPGGSSGGSGAVVAANETILALGSDTGGSIRCPASFTSTVGMKTTYGMVSRYGLVSYACSLEQIGPITKDVKDCALLLNYLVGYDPYDNTTVNRPKVNYLDYIINDVKNIKIAVSKEFLGEGINEEVKKATWDAISKLEGLGASYEEVSLPHINYALPCYYIIAMSEASSNLARFDGMRYGFRVDVDFNEWNKVYSENRRIGFGAEVRRRIILGTYALSSGYYDAYYLKALKVRTLIKRDFEEIFKKFDVLITPTMPFPAFKIGEKIKDPLSMYLADICTVPINIAGVPAISIPCGFTKQDSLPIGLQIVGNFFAEPIILRVANTFEQNTDFNKKRPKL